jgi:hypothetical protein
MRPSGPPDGSETCCDALITSLGLAAIKIEIMAVNWPMTAPFLCSARHASGRRALAGACVVTMLVRVEARS